MTASSLLLLVTWASASAYGTEIAGCVSKQYVELNTRGLILCRFPFDFESIHWYDNTDTGAKSTLNYDRITKSGDGFMTGEFDVYQNGTLIINNVSLLHEKTYKVVCFLQSQLFNTFHVDVIVTVTPPLKVPRVSNCNYKDEPCVIYGNNNGSIKCSVHGARPQSKIAWYKTSTETEEHINSTVMVTSDSSVTFQSVALLDLSNVSLGDIGHFTCRSKLHQDKHWTSKEVLIDMTIKERIEEITFEKIFREKDKRTELNCPERNMDTYLLKYVSSNISQPISYGTRVRTTTLPRFKTRYGLNLDGTLYIKSTKIQDEGKYICVSSNGYISKVKGIHLFTLVGPSPSYIEIFECTSGTCAVNNDGITRLTCSVTGVRPPVELQWKAEGVEAFYIENQTQNISPDTKGVFDVTSVVHLNTTSPAACKETIKLTCEALGEATSLFYSSQDVRLTGNCSSMTTTSVRKPENSKKLSITLVTVFAVVLVMTTAIAIIYFTQRRHDERPDGRPDGRDSEMRDLIPKQNNGREQFIKDLKTSYEEIVSNSSNVGQNANGMESVYIPSNFSQKPPSRPTFSKNKKQNNIITEKEIFSKLGERHVLIEGKSGIGKTAFVHQLLLSFSESGKKHVLPEVDIVIMVSLKKFTGIDLISFIKAELLPEDTELDSETIKTILKGENKLLVIFDDLDQYNDIADKDSEIHKILQNRKWRNFSVLAMCKPTQYENLISNNVAKFQMNPFSENQINEYVSGFFLSKPDGVEKIKRLKKVIDNNELVKDLCKTPLFLFMIASQAYKDFSMVSYFDRNTPLLDHLAQLISKDSNGNILCEKGSSDSCVSRISEKAFETINGSWEVAEEDKDIQNDITRLINKGVLMRTVESNKHGKRFLQFSHEMYKYFCAAHYAAYHADCMKTTEVLKVIDTHRNLQLFIYTCGLCHEQKKFQIIIRHLFEKQLSENYPYHIADCIVQCFKESNKDYHTSDLLEELCRREVQFNFKERDATDLRNAKISLINSCSSKKIPINALSIYNGIEKVDNVQIRLINCQDAIKFPESLQTVILADFEEKLKDTDVLGLIEQAPEIKEVFIHSSLIPKQTTEVFLDVLRSRKNNNALMVNWLTYRGEELHMISYPSDVFSCWLNCTEATAIKRFRQQEEYADIPPKERLNREKELMNDIKIKGVETFFKEILKLTRQETKKLLEELEKNMTLLKEIIDEWHNFYESTTDEEKSNCSEKFNELVNKLKEKMIKAEGGNRTEIRSEHVVSHAGNVQDPGSATSADPSVDNVRLFSTELKQLFFDLQLKHPLSTGC